ncbi:MAG: hypothetical protein WD114_04680 [Phycisphaerales bacterium]
MSSLSNGAWQTVQVPPETMTPHFGQYFEFGSMGRAQLGQGTLSSVHADRTVVVVVRTAGEVSFAAYCDTSRR